MVSVKFTHNDPIAKYFTGYLPRRLEFSVARKGHTDKELEKANHLDYIDFHYRRYLIGYRKTLHRVIYELKNSNVPPEVINTEIFECIEKIISHYNLDDLKVRHQNALKRIQRILKKQTNKP